MEEAGVAKEVTVMVEVEDMVMGEEEVMDMVEEDMDMVEEEAKGLEVLVTTSSRSDLTSRTRV